MQVVWLWWVKFHSESQCVRRTNYIRREQEIKTLSPHCKTNYIRRVQEIKTLSPHCNTITEYKYFPHYSSLIESNCVFVVVMDTRADGHALNSCQCSTLQTSLIKYFVRSYTLSNDCNIYFFSSSWFGLPYLANWYMTINHVHSVQLRDRIRRYATSGRLCILVKLP